MSEDQILQLVASALVGLLTAAAISKVFNAGTAAVVTPIVTLLAHKQFDKLVAAELRRSVR